MEIIIDNEFKYEYDDSNEAAQEAVKIILDFINRFGLLPDDESLFQRDIDHMEFAQLLSDVLNKGLKFQYLENIESWNKKFHKIFNHNL